MKALALVDTRQTGQFMNQGPSINAEMKIREDGEDCAGKGGPEGMEIL